MMTREADYAIRIVLALTRHAGEAGAVSAMPVAQEMDIPYRFVRKIAGKLVRAGIVRSTRGRAGGLRLARRPAALSVLDVLNAIDPAVVTLNLCMLDPRKCRRFGLCEIHSPLARVQTDLERSLAAITFADLAAPVRG
jgi:Rrf2 family protein